MAPIDEGLLVANRISELEESPITGLFDTAHLRAVHRHIFQDLPHHHPGQFRRDAPAWVKSRELESGERYYVPYAPRRIVEQGLMQVLRELHGPTGFKGLVLNQFATRMAQCYANLDYLHPFSEGNSRTLRTFTRQLAREAGFELDWSPRNADGVARDRLYRARDVAVILQTYSGLDEQRAMATEDRMEYETYFVLRKLQTQAPSLAALIQAYATQRSSDPSYTRDENLES